MELHEVHNITRRGNENDLHHPVVHGNKIPEQIEIAGHKHQSIEELRLEGDS